VDNAVYGQFRQALHGLNLKSGAGAEVVVAVVAVNNNVLAAARAAMLEELFK
jgi:hypothetical protein